MIPPGAVDPQSTRVLLAFLAYRRERPYPPTYRELSALTGLTLNMVSRRVQRLIDETLLEQSPGQPRTLRTRIGQT